MSRWTTKHANNNSDNLPCEIGDGIVERKWLFVILLLGRGPVEQSEAQRRGKVCKTQIANGMWRKKWKWKTTKATTQSAFDHPWICTEERAIYLAESSRWMREHDEMENDPTFISISWAFSGRNHKYIQGIERFTQKQSSVSIHSILMAYSISCLFFSYSISARARIFFGSGSVFFCVCRFSIFVMVPFCVFFEDDQLRPDRHHGQVAILLQTCCFYKLTHENNDFWTLIMWLKDLTESDCQWLDPAAFFHANRPINLAVLFIHNAFHISLCFRIWWKALNRRRKVNLAFLTKETYDH